MKMTDASQFHENNEQIQKDINEKLHMYTPGIRDKVRERLRDRVCCNMCAGALVVGIILASSLFASLIAARLAPRSHTCGMGCILLSASWTNFSLAQLERHRHDPPESVLDALSTAFSAHHADHFSSSHREKHTVHRLKDAHNRMADELQSVAARFQNALSMEDGQDKADKLKEIIERAGALERMADEVKQGKSFDEVKLSKMTETEASAVRACADTLRMVGAGPCREDLGTTTDFLRAVGASDKHEPLQPLAPTWPLNMHYPGVQTLNAEHGIHVVDGFLSPSECADLVQSSKLEKQQNRSAVTYSSFASVQSSSPTGEKLHKRRTDKKWFYSGMPGALIQLDIHSKGLKDCKPLLHDETAAAWTEAMAPIFQENGQDLAKCEKDGFGDTRIYDVACPPSAGATQQFERKVAALVQAPPTQLSPPQLLHYGRGDFDMDHYDTDAANSNDKVAPLWTVMVYLTSATGGGTYFPHLDLRVNPMVGRALIFPTLNMNLTLATGSLHAEEEVKQGDKWVLGTSLVLGNRTLSPSLCRSP